jgi:hypothetical protein
MQKIKAEKSGRPCASKQSNMSPCLPPPNCGSNELWGSHVEGLQVISSPHRKLAGQARSFLGILRLFTSFSTFHPLMPVLLPWLSKENMDISPARNASVILSLSKDMVPAPIKQRSRLVGEALEPHVSCPLCHPEPAEGWTKAGHTNHKPLLIQFTSFLCFKMQQLPYFILLFP